MGWNEGRIENVRATLLSEAAVVRTLTNRAFHWPRGHSIDLSR